MRPERHITESETISPAPLAVDLVWGVKGPHGIAACLGLTPRQTYYLIGIGKLPVRRLSHRMIVASRTDLLRALTGNTSEAA